MCIRYGVNISMIVKLWKLVDLNRPLGNTFVYVLLNASVGPQSNLLLPTTEMYKQMHHNTHKFVNSIVKYYFHIYFIHNVVLKYALLFDGRRVI